MAAETLTLSGVIWMEEDLYIAWCPELDIASQGTTIEEALKNLQEAIELYLEDEDAKVSKRKFTLVTTLSVKGHAKTTSSFRAKSN